eukprot:3336407-Pleurochrysis_carterae.AAC.1
MCSILFWTQQLCACTEIFDSSHTPFLTDIGPGSCFFVTCGCCRGRGQATPSSAYVRHVLPLQRRRALRAQSGLQGPALLRAVPVSGHVWHA